MLQKIIIVIIIQSLLLYCNKPLYSNDCCKELTNKIVEKIKNEVTKNHNKKNNFINLTGKNNKYNLNKLKPNDLVIIDDETIKNNSITKKLENRNNFFCYKSSQIDIYKIENTLQKKISKITILAALPKNLEEIKKTFYNNVDIDNKKLKPVENLMTDTVKKFEQIDNTTIVSSNNDLIKNIEENLSIDNNLIIVFGHNDEGKLMLPNGELYLISDLYKKYKDNVTLMILSCDTLKSKFIDNTSGIVTTKIINFRDIIKPFSLLIKNLKNNGSFRYIDSINIINKGLKNEKLNNEIKIVVIAGGIIMIICTSIVTLINLINKEKKIEEEK